MSLQDISERICPFINDPDDDCYCMNIRSQTVEEVIYYCQENHQECYIFKRKQGNKQSRLNDKPILFNDSDIANNSKNTG